MHRGSWFYAFSSLAVVALFSMATLRGCSPFADGGARGYAGGVVRGPTHK